VQRLRLGEDSVHNKHFTNSKKKIKNWLVAKDRIEDTHHTKLRLGEKKKNKERKKIETTGQKYNGLPYFIRRP